MKKLKGFKATDKEGKCQGFQFEVGKIYKEKGEIKMCSKGFHFCKNAHDVLNYYSGVDSRFFEVEALGKVLSEEDKSVTNELKIIKEITKSELLQNTLKPKRIKKSKNSTTGYKAHSSTTGYGAHSITTGYKAHSSTTGYGAHSITTGYEAHSSTTGDWAHSITTGNEAHSSTTGYGAHSITTGNEAHSSTTGHRAHSITTGNEAHSSTTGYGAHSSTTGYGAYSSTTGHRAHSSTTGNEAHSSTTGENSISSALGIGSKAKAENGFIIVVDWRKDKNFNYYINKIHSAKIGDKINRKTIKKNHWYWFEDGKLYEEKQ